MYNILDCLALFFVWSTAILAISPPILELLQSKLEARTSHWTANFIVCGYVVVMIYGMVMTGVYIVTR